MKIIGIDLGTTNSVVSVYEMGTSHTIQLQGAMTTPSVIWVNPEGDYVVGREAKNHVATDPDHILESTKRDLGSPTTYRRGDETFTPTEAATIILAYLKREASKTLREEVNDVVITVPARFGFQEIGEVRKAAIDAGLNPLAIIPEPTAAAIRYGIDANAQQLICVIDLGGGTFDVTVLEVKYDRTLNKHIVTPVLWDGDPELGGNDFDDLIIDWMIQNGAVGYRNKLELKSTAEDAKIELASLNETPVSHPVYMPKEVILTRTKYKSLIQSKLEQIGNTIRKTVDNCIVEGNHIGMDDINRFVLVGGSCKHPLVKDYIEGVIGREAYAAPNLDYYVADGAAIYHHAMKNPHGNIVIPPNRLPCSLGTDVIYGDKKINAILLKKGTIVPCRAIQSAIVKSDGNPSAFLSSVAEGEEELFEENKEIQVFSIPLEGTNYIHPVFTEFILDSSNILSFNTYVINLNDANFDIIKDDLAGLMGSAIGQASLVDIGDWDSFYAKYSSYITKTPKELTLNIK